jgi:excisionase family DNA binding protein
VAHQPFKGIHIEIDVRQLCGGISRSTVMREIRRKRLACYRARRTLRFSEEHITKYLERVEQGVK